MSMIYSFSKHLLKACLLGIVSKWKDGENTASPLAEDVVPWESLEWQVLW